MVKMVEKQLKKKWDWKDRLEGFERVFEMN